MVEDETTLLDTLLACERAVWDALVTGDAAADAAALDDGFYGVYSTGFAGKADHVAQLADGPTIATYELSGARVMPLGHDHALLSYRSDYLRTGRTEREVMFVSSVWRRDADRWRNLFSQDTAGISV